MLTIGYGDFAPSMMATRIMALVSGFLGVVTIAILAAGAVAALGSQPGGPGRLV